MSGSVSKAGIKIKGMTCASCAARIEKAIFKMPGVQQVNVNFAAEKANITYDSGRLTVSDFIQKIKDVGYDVILDKAELGIKNMNCASCAAKIEKALAKAPGVYKASVNFATETATVEYNSSEIDIKNLINIVRKTGYDAFEKNRDECRSGKTRERTGNKVFRKTCGNINNTYNPAGYIYGAEDYG
nr:heavy metal-associated domain-containing protein [Biomaibacter acetigenes]